MRNISLSIFLFLALAGCASSGTSIREQEINDLRAAEDRAQALNDNKDAIDKTIRHHGKSIRKCFTKEAMAGHSVPYGRIIVHFVISGDGTASDSKVKSSTMNNPLVENCIADLIGDIKFPATKNNEVVDVDYPLSFAPPAKR